MDTSETVTHLPDKNAFVIKDGEDPAILEYQIEDSNMTIDRTYVPSQFRGKGYAAQLAEAAIHYAKEHNFKIIPECSYIASYLKRRG